MRKTFQQSLWGIALMVLTSVTMYAQVDVTASAGTTTGTYTDLKLAFDAINLGTHQGTITIALTGNQTTNFASAILNSNGATVTGGAASYSAITIRPTASVTVTGTPLGGRGVIELNGADNVTINGDNSTVGGTTRDLTIINAAAAATTYGSCVRVMTSATTNGTYESANDITIRNCIILGNVTNGNTSAGTSATSSLLSFGIHVGPNGGGTITAITSITAGMVAGTTANNFQAINNEVNRCGRGISFVGVAAANSTQVTVRNNIIGDQSTISYPTNAVSAVVSSPSTTVYSRGVFVQGTASLSIKNNSVKNIIGYSGGNYAIEVNTNIGVAGSGATFEVSSNTIDGVATNISNSGRGISLSSATNVVIPVTITDNSIKNIVTFGNTSNAVFISHSVASGIGAIVERNIISNIKSSTGGWEACGIKTNSGNAVTIQNNVIYDILNNTGPSSTSFGVSFGAAGIKITGGNDHKLYHNSINMFGTDPSPASQTNSISGILINANTRLNLDIRNNIIANNVTGSGTNKAYTALFLSGATSAAMNLTMNNNAYYCGTTTGMQGLAFAGTTSYNTANFYSAANFSASSNSPAANFRAFSTALGVVTNDNASFASTGAVPFTSNTDLTIPNSATPSQIESGGAVVGVTSDYLGSTRPGGGGTTNGGGTAPDMGAYEFDGSGLDAIAPGINYTTLINTCSVLNRTLSATITDASGVVTATNQPRVYYRNGASGAWFSQAGTLTSGTEFNGVWSFTIVAADMAGLASGDVVQYYIIAQDALNNVGASPGAGLVALSTNSVSTHPTTQSSYTISVIPSNPNTLSSRPSLCVSGSATLSLQSFPNIAGVAYQWEYASAASPSYTNAPGSSTGSTYNTSLLDESVFYHANIFCDGNLVTTSNDFELITFNPTVVTTTPGASCGAGTVTLGATPDAVSTIAWYASVTGGTALATGNTFTTPLLTNSTTYYVAANNGGSTQAATGGNTWDQYFTGGAFQTTLITGASMNFDVLVPTTLVSVNIYPSAAIGTSFTIEVRQGSTTGPLVGTYTGVTNVQNSGTPTVAQTVPLNFVLPAGTGYVIGFAGTNPNTWRSGSSALLTNSYPYTVPGVFSVTSSSLATYQYYFYNFVVSTGCESPRQAIVASITTPPTTDITPSQRVCNNETVTLEVSPATVGNFSSYTWSPVTNLYTDAAATIPYTAGTNASTVYFKAGSTAYSTATYTCSATGGAGGCNNLVSTTLTVQPAAVTVTAQPAQICLSGSSVLSLAGTPEGIQWQVSDGVTFNDIAGATATTYTTPNTTATTDYRARITTSSGSDCYNSSTYNLVVNTPNTGTAVGATQCGVGSAAISVAGSVGDVNWYAAATGGLPLAGGTNTTTYNTPVISANTTYYAAASQGGSIVPIQGGNTWNQYPFQTAGNFQTTLFASASMVFDVLTPTTIASLDIYPSAAIGTTFTIEVRQTGSTGTLFASYTGVTNVQNTGSPTVAQTVPVNFVLPPGTDYIIGFVGTNPNCWRAGSSTMPYPFTEPGVLSIKGSSFGNATLTLIYQYFFYNWVVSTGCSAPRVPVTVTVTNAAAHTITPNQLVCNNVVTPLSVDAATLANYTDYTWSPATGLFTDAAATIPYTTGTNASTVYHKSSTAGTVTYTCNASGFGCVNIATTTVRVQPSAVTITAQPASICVSGASTLSQAGAVTGIQWQDASGDIAGQTATTYATPSISTATDYFVKIADGTGATCFISPAFTLAVNNPVTGVGTGATRCGAGTANISVSGNVGDVYWYTAATGGTALNTTPASNFTTPIVSTNTTFYAEATQGGASFNGGRGNTLTAGSSLGASPRGVIFNTTSSLNINEVGMLCSGPAAVVTVSLYNSGGTAQIGSSSVVTIPANAGTSTVPVLINFPVSFQVPSAGTYRLFVTGVSTGSPLYYEFSGVTGYPYAVGSNLSITSSVTSLTGTASTTTYYYFYNIGISTGCSAPRVPVAVTVTTSPAITVTPSAGVACSGLASTLNVTSAGSYAYTWSNGFVGATQNVSPTSTTSYVVTAFNSTTQCQAIGTATINVNPLPPTPVMTPATSGICGTGVNMLSALSSVPSNVNGYIFATSTGATLDPMVGATQVLASSNDDTPTAAPANIGFTFNFNGVNYTQYSISPDGWILLGGATATSDFSNQVTDATNIPKIYPYWDDLATGTNGNVSVVVTGTAPNRIFKAQWFVTIPRATGGAATSTFQAWLYETTGNIEFRYGTMGPQTAGTASAGLTGGVTNFQSISFDTNTASTVTANDANANVPASGRMYSFFRPSATYAWGPMSTLYTDAAATTTYTGSNMATVYASPAATQVYTVTATNGFGCISTNTTTVTVASPNVSVITAPVSGINTICAGSSTNLVASSVSPGTYRWSTGATTQVITVNSANNFVVTFTSSEVAGCTGTASQAIAVSSVTIASATTATNATVTLGFASVTATGGVSPYTYRWSNGATGEAITAQSGLYLVTATDANGCIGIATVRILNSSPVYNNLPCTFQYFWPQSGAVVGSSNASQSCYTVQGNNIGADANYEPTDCGVAGDRGVWYFFRMPGCGASGASPLGVKISTNNTGTTLAGTKVAVYSVTNSNSCTGAGYNRIACSNDSNTPGCSGSSGVGTHGTLEFGPSAPDGPLMANGNYFIYVSGDNGSEGNFELSFEYVQNGNINVTAGPSQTQAVINVPNNGQGSFSPQWRPMGATGWASSNGLVSGNVYTLPANTLMPGVTYQFRALYACASTYNYVMASNIVNFATTPNVSTCGPVTGLACNAVAGNVTTTWSAAPAGTTGNLVVIARSGSTQLRGTTVASTATSVTFNCPGCTATNTSFTLQSNCGGAAYIANGNCAVSAAGQVMESPLVTFEYNGVIYDGIDFNDPSWALFGAQPDGDFIMTVANGQLLIQEVSEDVVANFDFELRPSVALDYTNVVISTEKAVDGYLSLSDMNGSILRSQTLKQVQNGTVVTLETSSLAAGLYIVSVRTEEGNVAKKLVVVK